MILFFIACIANEPPTPESLIDLLESPKEFNLELAKVKDPAHRDLLLLQVIVRQPKHSQYLCHKLQTKNAKEKCRQIIGRPHLSE